MTPMLGRVKSPIDSRDWKLANFLAPIQIVKTISLSPVLWKLDTILNQEDTPHCVGFSCAGFGNCLPIDDDYTDTDGHWFYYKAKEYDGEPKQENGSCMRSGAMALRSRNRIAGYAFAKNIWEVIVWLQTKGSLLVGTNWYSEMFKPNKSGFVKPSGTIEGGHAYLLIGFKPTTLTFTFANSWGKDWGQGGFFKMRIWDFAKLMDEDGEVIAAVELPK